MTSGVGGRRGVGTEDEAAAEAFGHAGDVSVGEAVAGGRAQFEQYASFGGEFGVFRRDQAGVRKDVHARADGGEVRTRLHHVGKVAGDAFPMPEDQRGPEFPRPFHGVGQQCGGDVDQFRSGEGFDARVERGGFDQRHERGQQDGQRRDVRPDDQPDRPVARAFRQPHGLGRQQPVASARAAYMDMKIPFEREEGTGEGAF